MEIKSYEELVRPLREKRRADYEAKKLDIREYMDGSFNECVATIKQKYPVAFFRHINVSYDTKTDRYVGKFAHGRDNEHSTIKLTNELATYLMAHREHHANGHDTYYNVYLHLDDKGCADDCLLVYN